MEVQTALDRCESRATYESLARRVTSRETSELNAVGPAASTRPALVKKQAAATGTVSSQQEGTHPCDGILTSARHRGKQVGEPSVPVLFINWTLQGKFCLSGTDK